MEPTAFVLYGLTKLDPVYFFIYLTGDVVTRAIASISFGDENPRVAGINQPTGCDGKPDTGVWVLCADTMHD